MSLTRDEQIAAIAAKTALQNELEANGMDASAAQAGNDALVDSISWLRERYPHHMSSAAIVQALSDADAELGNSGVPPGRSRAFQALTFACDSLNIERPNLYLDLASPEDTPQETSGIIRQQARSRGQEIVETLGEPLDIDQYESEHSSAIAAMGRSRQGHLVEPLEPPKPRPVVKKFYEASDFELARERAGGKLTREQWQRNVAAENETDEGAWLRNIENQSRAIEAAERRHQPVRKWRTTPADWAND
jgi:hypothetical protein